MWGLAGSIQQVGTTNFSFSSCRFNGSDSNEKSVMHLPFCFCSFVHFFLPLSGLSLLWVGKMQPI